MRFKRWSAVFALCALGAGPALAQYPAKPIMFVVPFAAGGDSDLSGRNLAQHARDVAGCARVIK